MSREQEIEQEIQAKGLNAPRLSPSDIDALIIGEEYIQRGDYPSVQIGPQAREADEALRCLTICILVLYNGFTVVGTSACASPENFDAELGKNIARDKARDQIWALEGYALKGRLYNAQRATFGSK